MVLVVGENYFCLKDHVHISPCNHAHKALICALFFRAHDAFHSCLRTRPFHFCIYVYHDELSVQEWTSKDSLLDAEQRNVAQPSIFFLVSTSLCGSRKYTPSFRVIIYLCLFTFMWSRNVVGFGGKKEPLGIKAPDVVGSFIRGFLSSVCCVESVGQRHFRQNK